MVIAQNVTNWFDLRSIFQVRKFQLDTMTCFRMVEEKQERVSLKGKKVNSIHRFFPCCVETVCCTLITLSEFYYDHIGHHLK